MVVGPINTLDGLFTFLRQYLQLITYLSSLSCQTTQRIPACVLSILLHIYIGRICEENEEGNSLTQEQSEVYPKMLDGDGHGIYQSSEKPED